MTFVDKKGLQVFLIFVLQAFLLCFNGDTAWASERNQSSLLGSKASPPKTRFNCADYYHFLARRLRTDWNPILAYKHARLRAGVYDNIVEGENLPGRFGGTRRVYRKKDNDKPWEYYPQTPGFNDILMDPQDFVTMIGKANAKKLGFELSDNKVIIPDSQELRGAINAFNSQFGENDARRIHLNFFEAGNKPLNGNEYRRRFFENAELPMAQSGRLRFHDFTAHAGAIFIPKEILVETQRRFKTFANFNSYLKAADPALSRLLWDMYERRVDSLIDVRSNSIHKRFTELQQGKRFPFPFSETYRISDSTLNIRPRDDVEAALLEIVHYTKLRPSQIEALKRHVKDYIEGEVRNDPTLNDLPFGLKVDPADESIGYSLPEKYRESVETLFEDVMRTRIKQVRDALSAWKPKVGTEL